MTPLYLLVLLYVVVLQHYCAFRVSFRFTKLNHRNVGSIPVRTIPNASLEKCLDVCIAGRTCGGVNYSRMRKFCEVLAYGVGDDADRDILQQILYVFIDHKDMKVTSEDSDEATDTMGGNFAIEECEPFRIENATVLGTFFTVGSKVKVVCNEHFSLIDDEGIMVCQPNRTWSNKPSCYWDCGEPPRVRGHVSAGPTTNGTVRTYTCQDEFFISGNRNQTTMNVTCRFGMWWSPTPRCVQDCISELKNASELMNVKRRSVNYNNNNNNNEDYDYYTYYCMDGFVGIYPNIWERRDKILYTMLLRKANNIRVYCDGTHPKWNYSPKCVKDCTNKPSTEGVKKVVYYLESDNLTATYLCRPKHFVYVGSTKLDLDTFNTICDQPNGEWTNSSLSCQKDEQEDSTAGTKEDTND